MSGTWAEVAASGTSPDRLQRVVARLLDAGGRPAAMLRDASAHDGPGVAPLDLVDAIAPPVLGPRDDVEDVAGRWCGLGVRAAVVGDPAYPRRLAAGWPLTAGPLVCAWRGPADGVPDRPAVAIVGARRATPYGTGVASWLAAAAADSGAIVVSGGALGIDAAAHRGALDATGATAVVLGCGHAVRYPRGHALAGGLFDEILDAGGWIVSELMPDAPPLPAHVLARNRIVAGLVDAVVVVEGGERSGSLRTAAEAAERGVPVLAVPGDVRAPGSVAPHRLLAEGAAPCTGPQDLLAALPGTTSPAGSQDTGASTIPADLRAELARRWPRPVRVDELAEAVAVPIGRVLAAITAGRVAGEIAEGHEGVRLRRAP